MSRKVALATDLRRSPSPFTFSTHLLADDATFQPCSPRALSSLKVVGDHFKDFFPLSKNFTDKQPPYYGFFTEDEFIGGHVSLRAVNEFISRAHPGLTAPILRVFQLGRAIIRCAHDVG